MPWWVGVVLAAVTYLVFSAIGAMTPPNLATAGPPAVVGIMAIAVSKVAKVVVPLLCLVGAALSAWQAQHRRGLAAQAQGQEARSAIDGMSWQDFERLVGEAFRMRGYSVTETGGGGADGGVDLVLRKGGDTFLVQAKQWRAFRVGVTVVRELYGVMAAKGAAGGFVVTSGTFTSEALAFADGRNVQLVDGAELARWLADVQKAGAHAAVSAARPEVAPGAAAPLKRSDDTPACPVCSRRMVRRTASRGANAGRAFWGCPGFPSCRGTRAAE